MKKILSIDGGGMMGIIPIHSLIQLEQDGGPLHKQFDLIVGSSTGGIIAALLATGVPATRISKLYRLEGKNIFKASWWHKIKTGFGTLGPKYQSGYDKIIKRYVGDEVKTNFMITTYNLSEGTPHFFKSWYNNYSFDDIFKYVSASAAAPTYFYPYKINDSYFIDGGMVANNPAICGYVEALRLWGPEEEYKILSYSTGTHERKTGKEVRRWNLITWARKAVSIIMDGGIDAVDYQLDKLLDKGYYKRVDIVLNENIEMDDVSSDTLDKLFSYSRRVNLQYPDLLNWLLHD